MRVVDKLKVMRMAVIMAKIALAKMARTATMISINQTHAMANTMDCDDQMAMLVIYRFSFNRAPPGKRQRRVRWQGRTEP